MKALWIGALVAGLCASAASAQEDTATPLPAQVKAIAGCWAGEGEVMGKAVRINVRAYPIALGAMFALDADSVASADASDAYAAHIVFGGRSAGGAYGISSFFADSFGGDMTSLGLGQASGAGFKVSYPYGANQFVNQWSTEADELSWQIVEQDQDGQGPVFASYRLQRRPCEGALPASFTVSQ